MIYAYVPKPTPKTNADRIRAMSDDELAEFISDHCIESLCDIVCSGKCEAFATLYKTSDEVCSEIILRWLKHSAEDRMIGQLEFEREEEG